MKLFRDKLRWNTEQGTIEDGPARYILVRADALMGLFRLLPAREQQGALQAFEQSVAEYGGKSARRYHEARPLGAPDILNLVVAGASLLGWGHWSLEPDDGRLIVHVENSPFVHGFGDAGFYVCSPIAGMLQAAATIACDQPMIAKETCCAAAGDGNCRFELAPARRLTGP